MTSVFINKIGTAVPPYDFHGKFIDLACRLLSSEPKRELFRKMAERGQIEHQYSFLQPCPEEKGIDVEGFYRQGRFPDTSARMRFFEQHAAALAAKALNAIEFRNLRDEVTHLIVGCCTGFYAPGLDLDIVK